MNDIAPSQSHLKIVVICVVVFLFFLAITSVVLWKIDTSKNARSEEESTHSTEFSVDNDFSDISTADALPDTENELDTSATEESTVIAENDSTAETTEETTVFVSDVLPLEFSYPTSWHLWEDTSSTSEWVEMSDFIPMSDDATLERIPGHKLEVVLVDVPQDMTIQEWVTQGYESVESGNLLTFDTVNIAGKEIVQSTSNSSATANKAAYIPVSSSTQQVVVFSLSGPEADPNDLTPLFQQLITTITFPAEQSNTQSDEPVEYSSEYGSVCPTDVVFLRSRTAPEIACTCPDGYAFNQVQIGGEQCYGSAECPIFSMQCVIE